MFTKYKKIFLIIYLVLIFLFLLIEGYNFIKKYDFKINNDYTINTDKNIVRIYYDFASAPTIYQVYDYIKQSPESVTFALWDRITNLEKNLSNQKNTYVMKHYENNRFDVNPEMIRSYLKKHPDAKFIIHSNANWVKNISAIIESIPEKSVKEIHLYEDGSFSTTTKMTPRQEIEFDFYKNISTNKYNIIYHFQDAKLLNSPKCLLYKRCRELKLKFKGSTVVQTGIKPLQEEFKKDKKIMKKYFSVYDFDYEKYNKEISHPFGVFLFTIYENDDFARQQLNFMNAIINGNLNYLIKDNNVKWFYKEHPAKNAPKSFSTIIDKENPDMKMIEKYIPFELFLLAGIVPDYIAGYSSSVFLSFPKNKIVAYIERPNDNYMYVIKRDRLIRNGRIFKISDCDDSIKSRIKRLISKFFVSLEKN